jgi:hypothetical protein
MRSAEECHTESFTVPHSRGEITSRPAQLRIHLRTRDKLVLCAAIVVRGILPAVTSTAEGTFLDFGHPKSMGKKKKEVIRCEPYEQEC